jgi:aminoglycoside phosphotransferase
MCVVAAMRLIHYSYVHAVLQLNADPRFWPALIMQQLHSLQCQDCPFDKAQLLTAALQPHLALEVVGGGIFCGRRQ